MGNTIKFTTLFLAKHNFLLRNRGLSRKVMTLNCKSHAKALFYTLPYGKAITCAESSEAPSQTLTYPFLAGLIDGDGFIRAYKDTGEYTITMHQDDEKLLLQLQNQLGGDVRKVPNKRAMGFHLNAKNAMDGRQTLIQLTPGINSHIRNSIRIPQFQELCIALQIDYSPAGLVSLENGYLAGLFCSDGSIYLKARDSRETIRSRQNQEKGETLLLSKVENKLISLEHVDVEPKNHFPKKIQRLFTGVAPRAEVSITAKNIVNVLQIKKTFESAAINNQQGNLRSPEGSFNFRLYKESDILKFADYMEKYKSESIKHKRLILIKKVYYLKNKKAHMFANPLLYSNKQLQLSEAETILGREWITIILQWFDYENNS